MNIKKLTVLLLAVILAASAAVGCSKNPEEEYAQIIDTAQMFSYAMSRAGGLFLVPVIDDFEKLSFSCSKGALYIFGDLPGIGTEKLELGVSDLEIFEDDVLASVYWMPEPGSEDNELPMTEATITVRAELDDGKRVYQIVDVVIEDGITFTLVDSKQSEQS